MKKKTKETKLSFEVDSYEELLNKAKELFNLPKKEINELRSKNEHYAIFKPQNVYLKYHGGGSHGISAIMVACPEKGNSLILIYPDIDFLNHALKIIIPNGVTSVEKIQTADSVFNNGNTKEFACKLNGKDCRNKDLDGERFFIASDSREDLEKLKQFIEDIIKLKKHK